MAQFQLSQANDLLVPMHLYKSTHFALDNSYIYDVTANSSHVIVSASNNQIKLYNPETLSIANTLVYHNEKITKIKPVGEHELFSASLDGQIARWDLRTNNVVQQFKAAPSSVSAFDINCNGTVIAAGSELEAHDAKLMFLDTRTSQMLASFDESHSDDITEINYHPTIPHQLISASTDGLICQFDTSTYDEEENIIAVINSGSSVNKAGYFGPSAEYIYCLTHIETLSLHNLEGDVVSNFGDIRQATQPGQLQVDYAVDCRYEPVAQRLYMLTGSNSGDINVMHVNIGQLQLCQSLKGGHTEVIRSIHWNPQDNVMFSGGEDAKLCTWSNAPPPADATGNGVVRGLPSRMQTKRHSPY
ncbi:hypothetical protein INT43_003068 [Umbelopsis isabellina]|uniref:WD40 repeat-like protein n=1 Tax=Mortierella isabellina TaxID=91625 RepID=A0A8H7PPR0_MORIS|nr:hypothetical protein INT43_003068 [Umbelopsis isabellina]